MNSVFVGPYGVRSGWRAGLFYLIMIGPLAGIAVLIRHFQAAHTAQHLTTLTPALAISNELSLLFFVVLATVVLHVLERKWTAEGLQRRRIHSGLPLNQEAWGRAAEGALWGFGALSLLLGVLAWHGNFSLGGLVSHGPAIAGGVGIWALVFILVAFTEELGFRGYSLFALTQGRGFWVAAVILSFAFGAIHLQNSGEGRLGALSAGLIGLFFCYTVRRTGTLWYAIGFHAAWDFGETYFYGVPDSGLLAKPTLFASSFHGSRWWTGGSIGPEGSLAVFALIALLFVLFNWRARGLPGRLPEEEAPAEALESAPA